MTAKRRRPAPRLSPAQIARSAAMLAPSGWLECPACGDEFQPRLRTAARLRDEAPLEPAELAYCEECANELFRGVISTRPAKTYPTGGGCPLEPNPDDGGPWQENNIRHLEDRRAE